MFLHESTLLIIMVEPNFQKVVTLRDIYKAPDYISIGGGYYVLLADDHVYLLPLLLRKSD